MKYLFIIVLLSITAIANDFDLMPLQVHFNGVVSVGDNVIAYGTNGVYFSSKNKGIKWKYNNLKNFGEIRSILNYNDTLWGIVKEGYIIISSDSGKSWTEAKFDIDQDYFLNFDVSDDYICVRTISKIIKFDKLLNKVGSYENERIKIRNPNRIGLPDEAPDVYYHHSIMIFNKNIYFSDPQNKTLLFLSKDFLLDSIDINQIDYDYPVVQQYFKHKDNLIVQVGSQLYNIIGTQLLPHFKDSIFLNNEYLLKRNITPYFFNYKNKFYLAGFNKNIMRLYQVNEDIDSLIELNNFENNYYTNSYFLDGGSNALSRLLNSSLFVLQDSIFIRCGWAKSLLSSFDGKSWTLQSLHNASPISVINDSTYIFVETDNAGRLNLSTSSDYGITSQPPLLDSIYRDKDVAGLFDKIFASYCDRTGKGFITGFNKYVNYPNIIFTNDHWKNLKVGRINGLFSGYSNHSYTISNILKMDNVYKYYLSDNNYSKNYNINIDTSFTSANYTLDSSYIVHYVIRNKPDEIYLFVNVKDAEGTHFEVRETNDSGKTFNTKIKMNEAINVQNVYEHNDDSVFIISSTKIYLYDKIMNNVSLIYELNNDENKIFFVRLNSKFYILGKELFLVDNLGTFKEWTPVKWDYGVPSFYSVVSNGRIALVKMHDNTRPMNYYRLSLMSDQVSVENHYEILYKNNHFYASPSFPLPAKREVKSIISWDMSFNLDDAIDGVYDIHGIKIDNKENIKLTYISKATSEITWDCSYFPNGIYFIVVHHSGRIDTIPVVVER